MKALLVVGGTSAGGRRKTADENGAAEWSRAAAGALKRCCCCCGRRMPVSEKLVHDGIRVFVSDVRRPQVADGPCNFFWTDRSQSVPFILCSFSDCL